MDYLKIPKLKKLKRKNKYLFILSFRLRLRLKFKNCKDSSGSGLRQKIVNHYFIEHNLMRRESVKQKTFL